MRWILITFLGIVSFVAFVFYYKIYSNSTQKNNNFDFCYLMTWNEISWNAILLLKKITMQAGNEKIIMNGLKLDNLKVKNKKKKNSGIIWLWIIAFYTANFTLSFAISVLIGNIVL